MKITIIGGIKKGKTTTEGGVQVYDFLYFLLFFFFLQWGASLTFLSLLFFIFRGGRKRKTKMNLSLSCLVTLKK